MKKLTYSFFVYMVSIRLLFVPTLFYPDVKVIALNELKIYYDSNIGYFRKLNIVLFKKQSIINLLLFKLEKIMLFFAYVFHLLFGYKNELEIVKKIGLGFTIFHGYGMVIFLQKEGFNLRVWQFVTICQKPKPNVLIDVPLISDNISIYTNAVVAGDIRIGNNVLISAGSFVNFDVTDHHYVFKNPGVIHN